MEEQRARAISTIKDACVDGTIEKVHPVALGNFAEVLRSARSDEESSMSEEYQKMRDALLRLQRRGRDGACLCCHQEHGHKMSCYWRGDDSEWLLDPDNVVDDVLDELDEPDAQELRDIICDELPYFYDDGEDPPEMASAEECISYAASEIHSLQTKVERLQKDAEFGANVRAIARSAEAYPQHYSRLVTDAVTSYLQAEKEKENTNE